MWCLLLPGWRWLLPERFVLRQLSVVVGELLQPGLVAMAL